MSADGLFRTGRSRPTTAIRSGLTASRVALALATVVAAGLAAADVHLGVRRQAAVYLFGMVALNLPHGGYEHFTNLRRRANAFRWRYVAAYLALVAGFLALFFLAPLAGLVLAIGVACAKGGHGGLKVMAATYGTDHLRTRLQRALAVAVRGGVVMLVPLYFHTGTFAAYSSYMVSMFDPGALAPVAAHVETTRLLAGVGWAALAATHVGLGALRGGGRSWLFDAGETLLLGAYFAVVPVVVAVGLYFPLWYSARQVARHGAVDRSAAATDTVDDDDASDLLAGESATAVALRAWGTLVGGAIATGVVVSIVYLAAPNPLGTAPLLPGLVAFWSVTISIIALPHVVVGSWADAERGIWYVP